MGSDGFPRNKQTSAFQVGLQLLNLTNLVNKQELMLRVMGADAKESDPAVLSFMEGVFSNQLAELERSGLMIDGAQHYFTFYNKVNSWQPHSSSSKSRLTSANPPCRRTCRG